MTLSGETKFFIGVIVTTLIIVVGAVVFFSKPAKEVSPEVLVASDSWATGSATPKVTLVEFSDFECPACGAAHPIVKEVVAKYADQLKFVYRHFPLAQHASAQKAAEAAEAAGAQGKFWEMHNSLFASQANLSNDEYQRLATELKLDTEKFRQELEAGTYAAKVQKDMSDGVALGVNSTPTFFLNGKKLNLFSFADLETEITKVLQ